MVTGISRRRFVTIAAATALLPGTAARAGGIYRWRGMALGAEASLTLSGLGEREGASIAARIEREIARLEEIFSLYRPHSAISRLNRSGSLSEPPPELLEVLSLCRVLHDNSSGAFDPTVQPLWLAHANAAATGRHATADEKESALRSVGWPGLVYDASSVSFSQPGMALTLNGIAQGYITDRVAALLRREGMTDVLVHMGETRALGGRPDGTSWRAAIADPHGRILRQLSLRERALATSAPFATFSDQDAGIGHIFDPSTGAPARRWRLVSVSARNAALADGLSTAFCAMPRAAISATLARFQGAVLEAIEA